MDIETESRNHRFLSRDAIKYVAMAAMLLNHIASIFLTPGSWLFEGFLAIGYFTAITMVYFLVEGYFYTHDRKAYFLRLLAFALLSQIPYCLAFTTEGIIQFCGLNMLFTLCLCFGVVYVLDTVKSKAGRMVLVALGVLVSLVCDWALLAPVFTVLFVWGRRSARRTKAAFALSIGIFGAFNFLGGVGRFSFAVNLLYALLSVAGMGLAAICLVFFYNGRRMEKGQRFSKWFFYLFYPVHLLLLGLLRLAWI